MTIAMQKADMLAAKGIHDLTDAAAQIFTPERAGAPKTATRGSFVRPLAQLLPDGPTKSALLSWCAFRTPTGDLAEKCRLSRVTGRAGDPDFERRCAEHHVVEATLRESAARAAEEAGATAISIAQLAEASVCGGGWPGCPAASRAFADTLARVLESCRQAYASDVPR